MMRVKTVTAVAALATFLGSGAGALADGYADGTLELSVVTGGTASDGTTLSTNNDYNLDNEFDALGAPEDGVHARPAATSLGFDQNGTIETADDLGGYIILAFQDNICLDGEGGDFRVFDIGDDEPARVEVSNDSGQTFVSLGDVVPGQGVAGYTLDLNQKLNFFNAVKITATAPGPLADNWAGIDLEAVDCIYSVDPATADPDVLLAVLENGGGGSAPIPIDNCDLASPEPSGVDIRSVAADSDGSSIFIDMALCAPALTDKAVYEVHFDFANVVDTDGDTLLHDGPDSLDSNPSCVETADSKAIFRNGAEKRKSPGIFLIGDNLLTLEVNYDELVADDGSGVATGSRLLFWIQTRNGDKDQVPTTERGDGCGKPQILKEVFDITLN